MLKLRWGGEGGVRGVVRTNHQLTLRCGVGML